MSDKERELVEYFIKIVEETPSLHEKWINPPIKITTWKHLLEQDKEIERLNNIIKTKDEGIKAFTEDLCEESTKVEKLEKLNKKLWEENTRLSNGRELEQNAIDTLRDRIDKAIEYINNCSLPTTTNEYILSPNHLIDILQGSEKE